MIHLTFAAEFNSVHMMRSPALGEEENYEIFGKCANPSGHGHRYRMEVTVSSEVSPKRPYVISRVEIDRLIDEVLSPRFHHQSIDAVFGPDFVSSGENIAKAIWELLIPELDKEVSLESVKVIETHKNAFVYRGGSGDSSRRFPL